MEQKNHGLRRGLAMSGRCLAIAAGFTAIGFFLRWWPLSSLGATAPWLTFYPVVMVAAILGGLYAGLLTAGFTCLVVLFAWPPLLGNVPISKHADWVGLIVFFCNAILMAVVAELMRRAQRRAHEAQEQAERANRAKSAFLASMSHELRTPLNAILGFSRLLNHASNLTPDQVKLLGIIARSGEHLLNLINNVLDMSKIESGHIVIEECPSDLQEILQEVLSLMAQRAGEKHLALHLEAAPDLPRRVLLDTGKLRQVLINLVGNAVKFTEDGFVTLRARSAGVDSDSRCRLRFEVEDSGPGIPPADREKVFQPFVQAADSTAHEAGSGLGLAICRQNIEVMNGEIGIGEKSGPGALFFVEIPAGVMAGESPLAEILPHRVVGLAPGEASRRLLIVEDQSENRLLLRSLLAPLGFDLQEAVNGKEAVALAAEWRPDLIWMDIRMPVMDGITATRMIRQTAAGRTTKIVALTAHALEEERREILEAGCDQWIRKPYREKEIFDALAQHLSLRFVYETDAAPTDRETLPDAPLCAADLAVLPSPLRDELEASLKRLDGQRALAVADRCAVHEAALAARLRQRIADFQFGELLAAIQGAQTGKGGGRA